MYFIDSSEEEEGDGIEDVTEIKVDKDMNVNNDNDDDGNASVARLPDVDGIRDMNLNNDDTASVARFQGANGNRDASSALTSVTSGLPGAVDPGLSGHSLLSAASSSLAASVPRAPSAIDAPYLRVVKLHILVFEIGAATLEAEMARCVRKRGYRGWKEWLEKNEGEAKR